jgi:hypothetical protein
VAFSYNFGPHVQALIHGLASEHIIGTCRRTVEAAVACHFQGFVRMKILHATADFEIKKEVWLQRSISQ